MLHSLDRSFLFGRLLAIIERKERVMFSEENSEQYNVVTSSQKFWIHYRNRPASTLQMILDVNQPHVQDFIRNNFWMYVKFELEIQQVVGLLEQYHLTQDLNRPLNHLFVWGYYSELSF